MKVKQHKIKLILLYIVFILIIYAISFISSSFLLIKECELGCIIYFLPLSYPLELSVYISPVAIYPPLMSWRMTIFGFDVMNVTGQFLIELNSETRFITDLITQKFIWIIFSINLGFILFWIAILYLKNKMKLKKEKRLLTFS